jgi:hypothetical protein
MAGRTCQHGVSASVLIRCGASPVVSQVNVHPWYDEVNEMKITRSITVSILLVCSVAFCVSQDPSKIASITVEQPKQSAHVGDTVRLKATVANLSKGEIILEGPAGGAWETEVYDLLDPTGKDLALPSKQRDVHGGDPGRVALKSSIPVGGNVTDYVLLGISPEIFSHQGTYRLILDKREWANNVVIRSNPVNIIVIPK